MSIDLLTPMREMAGAAMTAGSVVLAVVVLLLLSRDLAQTRFSDERRNAG